jgi:hypothetical protein
MYTLLEAFLNMSQTSTCFNHAAFFCAKAKLLVLRLLSSSARLSGFPIYWMPDYRNFTAINNDDDKTTTTIIIITTIIIWFLEICPVSI